MSALSEYTTISTESRYPHAIVKQSIPFSAFSSAIASSPTSSDTEKQLFKLSAALFDPLLSEEYEHLPQDTQHQIEHRRRVDALSSWLSEVVRINVESDLRKIIPSNLSHSSPELQVADAQNAAAQKLFILLSGFQRERAISLALDSSLPNLALLIAQCGPQSDEEFKDELSEQLAIWETEKTWDASSQEGGWVRRVWELVAGRVTPSTSGSGSSTAIESLGWKRALGMRLWFGASSSPPAGEHDEMEEDRPEGGKDHLSSVIKEYETLWRDGRCPEPSPPWSNSLLGGKNTQVFDAHYLLLRLFTSPSLYAPDLPNMFHPLSYSPSPFDTRLPFYMSMLIGGHEYGISATLAEAYASLLENVGAVREAVLALMFLPSDEGYVFVCSSLTFKMLTSSPTGERKQSSSCLHGTDLSLSSRLQES